MLARVPKLAGVGNLEEFNSHKHRLLGLAYRMLGRWSEAEDVVQEAYLRWSRCEEVERPQAFLCRVVTRLCLDHLKSAAGRREVYPGVWLPEPCEYAPSPEAGWQERESLRFAMVKLLQELDPKERAAYLLHEVLDTEYAEVGECLGLTPTYCRQLVSRAKKRLHRDESRFEPDPGRASELLERFLACVARGEYEELVTLLQRDIVLWSDGGGKARAAVNPVHGSDRVARFFLGIAKKNEGARVDLRWLNGEPAVLVAQGDERWTLMMDWVEDRLAAVFVVANPDKLSHL